MLSPTQANFGCFQREVIHLENAVKACGLQCTVFNVEYEVAFSGTGAVRNVHCAV